MNIERREKKNPLLHIICDIHAATDSPLTETMSQHLNKTPFVGSTRTGELQINE
jgi:hypothetical protein